MFDGVTYHPMEEVKVCKLRLRDLPVLYENREEKMCSDAFSSRALKHVARGAH